MSIGAFAFGFIVGSFAASVVVVFLMAAMAAGKISDMQDRIDELELGR